MCRARLLFRVKPQCVSPQFIRVHVNTCHGSCRAGRRHHRRDARRPAFPQNSVSATFIGRRFRRDCDTLSALVDPASSDLTAISSSSSLAQPPVSRGSFDFLACRRSLTHTLPFFQHSSKKCAWPILLSVYLTHSQCVRIAFLFSVMNT